MFFDKLDRKIDARADQAAREFAAPAEPQKFGFKIREINGVTGALSAQWTACEHRGG
jgi:hypothetical protein